MSRWLVVAIALIFVATGVDFACGQGMGLGWSGSGNQSGGPTVPTLIAGTATPQSEDAVHPSMSRWDPSCLDSTWGTGCNVATQTCKAPTVGTPDQPCQPPLQLNVTGGTGNGTTATINYYSAAGYAFPVGTPLNVKGSTDWDTPAAGVVSYLQSTTGHCTTSGHTCITLGLAPMTGTGPVTAGSVPFIPGTPIYVQGTTGQATEYGGSTNWGFGWNQVASTVTPGSYNNTTGVLIVNIDNPYFGAAPSPGTLFNLGGQSYSGGTCTAPCGLQGWLTLSAVSNGGDTLEFDLAAGLASANLGVTAGGIVTSAGEQGPNGKFTPDGTWSGSVSSISYDINSTFPYGFQGAWGCHTDASCLASSGNTTNYWNYNGLIYQPWVVTASSCAGTSCSVSFLHPTACASSCVTSGLNGTQIVAGQFSPPIMAWNTGPIAPFAVENGTLTKCVVAFGSGNNPLQFVKMALDGGAFVTAKYMLDPWGVGAASNPHDPNQASVTNNTYGYCAKFSAATVADGLHEIRAIGCATAGPCAQLTSGITAEATNGSSTLLSTSHYQNDTNRLGITQSQDSRFRTYNNAYITTTALSATASFVAGTPPHVTYTYTPGTATLPIPAGMPVNVSGFTTNDSCSITGGTATGNSITYNYSGGCDFPVGTKVNVAGLAAPTTQTATITGSSYNSGTGVLSVTISSALWGATPGYPNITQWTVAGATGTNASSVNGTQIQVSTSGSGTVFNFQLATGLSFTLTSGTLKNPNNYSWNGIQIPVTATDDSTFITVTGMSLSAYNGGTGTIKANWNEYCFPSSVTPTSITCPLPANSPSTTAATNGVISVNANLMCVVGGEGDNYPPFDPSFTPSILMDPNHFQIINYMLEPSGAPTPGTTCSDVIQNLTGCASATCGIQASKNSTLWMYRKDAGTLEFKNNGSGTGVFGQVNDGSLWVYTNAAGTIQEQAAYVDQWNPSAVSVPATGACTGPLFAAMNWNDTRPAYAGSYCVNAGVARRAFFWANAPNVGATVGNSGGCSTFTSSTYNVANVAPGVPMIFLGIDGGAAGDGSNALFSNQSLYWVQSNTAGTVTLAATPGGPCLNETGSMSGIQLQQDLGFRDVFFKCNTSLGCSSSNPETVELYSNGSTINNVTQYAKSGWFNNAPDTGNGTTQHEVTLLYMPALNSDFAVLGGRARSQLDRSWKDLTVTPVVTLGPTLPVTTVTGGSFSAGAVGSCPANCETLTFTAGANQYAGAKFQAPTATGGPGQTITAAGVTGTSGTWNCSNCTVTDATTTSVTFVNAAASGSWSSGGTITPLSLAIEIAAGSFPPGTAACASASFIPITPPGGSIACIAGTGSASYNGLTNLYPVSTGSTGSNTQVSQSNCLLTNNGPPNGTVAPFLTSVIPSTGAGVNDIMILSSNSTAAPVYAFNQCASVQFYTGGPFVGNGAVDGWDSEATITGPAFWEDGGSIPGNVLPSPSGQTYITDLSSYNADAAFDYSSYVWGSSSIWNLGICHNQAATAIHMRCAGSWKMGPSSIGAVDYRTPPTVLHSYASYAEYLSNTPITCGGVDCIVRSGASGNPCTAPADCTNGSLVFKLSDAGGGTIASPTTLGFSALVLCGYYPNGWPQQSAIPTVNPGTSYITWFDRTANVVMLNAPMVASCNPITSSAAYFTNSYHTDIAFYRSGPFDIPSFPHEFANRLPWTTLNDFIYDQVDSTLSGDLEGLFTEGGNQNNVAVVNSYIAGIPGPGPISGPSGIDVNSYGAINWLNLNDSAGASVIPVSYNANTNPSYIARAPQSDVYYINLNSGPSMYGFPLNQQPDQSYNMRFSSAATWSFRVESNGIVGSPLNPGGWWPSPAWAVNAAGVPVVNSGQPGYNNLLDCPWYCAATDTGNSLN